MRCRRSYRSDRSVRRFRPRRVRERSGRLTPAVRGQLVLAMVLAKDTNRLVVGGRYGAYPDRPPRRSQLPGARCEDRGPRRKRRPRRVPPAARALWRAPALRLPAGGHRARRARKIICYIIHSFIFYGRIPSRLRVQTPRRVAQTGIADRGPSTQHSSLLSRHGA